MFVPVCRPAMPLTRKIARWIRGRFGGLMLMLMTAAALAQSASGTFNDHQNMMDQLGVKKLRPGPNPNNQSTFDEATANPYTNSMPDVLTMNDGTKVMRPEQWPARHAEIQEDFEREVYGRIPAKVPKVNWEVTATTFGTNGGIPTVTKTLVGHVDNRSYTNLTVNIQASFTVPANATAPVPVMIEFGFGGFGFGGPRSNAVAALNRSGTNAPGTNVAVANIAIAGTNAVGTNTANAARARRGGFGGFGGGFRGRGPAAPPRTAFTFTVLPHSYMAFAAK